MHLLYFSRTVRNRILLLRLPKKTCNLILKVKKLPKLCQKNILFSECEFFHKRQVKVVHKVKALLKSNEDHVGAQISATNPSHQTGALNNNHHSTSPTSEDLRFHGSELVMLYDYKAQAPDDLSVRRGDWVYADMNNQTVDGWLWAYAPKTRKYGFIPKAYARPPAMTSL